MWRCAENGELFCVVDFVYIITFYDSRCPMMWCSKSQVGISWFICNKPQVQVTHTLCIRWNHHSPGLVFAILCGPFDRPGVEVKRKRGTESVIEIGKLLSLRLYSSFICRIYPEFQVDGPTLLPSIDWFIIAPYYILNILNQLWGEILCHVLWWCSLANP